MFGLLDCNNFYVSCHRVFRPDLNGKPVIVLSNNDGCVIARSEEAKALGIGMAVPLYQVKHLIETYNVTVFSSTYPLYGDMSSRVISILRNFVPEIEIYSIDEAFLNFSGMERTDLKAYGEHITQTVIQWTGLPVSLGIAPTKTLAKSASKFAKKFKQYNHCCVIDSEEKRIKALKRIPIEDIWGIGRQFHKHLNKYNVKNAYDFTNLPRSFVRKHLTVIGERTWVELNGEPCIGMDVQPPPNKSICTSRMFGNSLTKLDELSEAIASYACICAEKLRQQKSYAVAVAVFIHTNGHRKDHLQYSQSILLKLPVPTDSTLEIVKYALKGLRNIFREGFFYKKGGVVITDIIPNNSAQGNLFYHLDSQKHDSLMHVMDKFNNGFLQNKLLLAVQGTQKKWEMKQESKSPHYTTSISDILQINCT